MSKEKQHDKGKAARQRKNGITEAKQNDKKQINMKEAKQHDSGKPCEASQKQSNIFDRVKATGNWRSSMMVAWQSSMTVEKQNDDSKAVCSAA